MTGPARNITFVDEDPYQMPADTPPTGYRCKDFGLRQEHKWQQQASGKLHCCQASFVEDILSDKPIDEHLLQVAHVPFNAGQGEEGIAGQAMEAIGHGAIVWDAASAACAWHVHRQYQACTTDPRDCRPA